MFPQGGPGVALLLLRISVAAIVVMGAFDRSGASSYLLVAGAFVLAALLIVGFMTPLASVIASLSGVANLLIGPHPNQSTLMIVMCPVLDAAALALLGPGAYSLDAWLFGRRVMVVPPRKDPNDF